MFSSNWPENKELPFPYSSPTPNFNNTSILSSCANSHTIEIQQEAENFGRFPVTLPSVTSLDILNTVLTPSRLFIFHPTNKIELDGAETLVQLHDERDERGVVLTMRTIVGGVKAHGRRRYQFRDTETKILNPDGHILLYSERKFGQKTMTVTSGSQILAIVDGVANNSNSFVVRDTLGKVLFYVGTSPNFSPSDSNSRSKNPPFDGDAPNCFFNLESGQEIAKLGKNTNDQNQNINIGFSISRDLGKNLKAVVVACAYEIYILYYAPSKYGEGGVKKVAQCQKRRQNGIFIACIIFFFILFVLVRKF